jgi:hypothetical protein
MSMRVHNEEFYHALYNLSKKVVELIKTPERQKIIRRRFTILDPEKLKWDWIDKEYFEHLVISRLKEIYTMKEFKTCKSIIESDYELSWHYNRLIRVGNTQRILFEGKTLLYIIAGLMEQTEAQKISRKYYNELYSEFESLIYSDSIAIVYLIPLTSFTSEKDVRISNELSIRKMSISEREEWANLPVALNIPNTVLPTKYTIEFKHNAPKDIDTQKAKETDKKIVDKMYNLVSSLRLLKNGYFDDYCLIKKIGSNIPHNILSYQSQSYSDFSLPVEYTLSKSDRPMIISNYNLINRLKENKIKENLVNNALLWLSIYSKERDHFKGLIYLAIVLETLLSDSQNAITHKLCCRTANILESRFNEKQKIYDNINKFYKTRSKLLHGEDTKPFEDIHMTDTYVRKMMLKVLTKISNFDKQKSFDKQYSRFLRQIDFGNSN